MAKQVPLSESQHCCYKYSVAPVENYNSHQY